MIFITGDTHGVFSRFSTKKFKVQKGMTKDDYIIIDGDFGSVWNGAAAENYWLSWLNKKPFTVLFIDGNHENFELLGKYPVEQWNGGKVHFIRPSVIHLMRGQVFTIDGCKIFTMGGARSHDIDGGILDREDPLYRKKVKHLKLLGKSYRVDRVSWWDGEMPSKEELFEGLVNLNKHDNTVDYILSHEAPTHTKIGLRQLERDQLSEYLQLVDKTVKYKKWYFGHYHMDKAVADDKVLVYKNVVQIW